MKKALLIGIRYFDISGVTLNGCINDIQNINNMLIDAYDYDSSNIIMLRDDSEEYMQPTRANILLTLDTIVRQTSNLDEIWIHYSGHGSQIKDNNGDEVDGLDDVLVPVDYQTTGYIADDEILIMIKNIKCKAIIIFDCCHSGTICDLPWSYEFTSSKDESMEYIKSGNNDVVIDNKNIYMISGCKDYQTSADTFDNSSNQFVGALTTSLIDCLRYNKHDVDIMTLYRDVCVYLLTFGYKQIPILSSSSTSPDYSFKKSVILNNAFEIITPESQKPVEKFNQLSMLWPINPRRVMNMNYTKKRDLKTFS
jgi:hypothetical protein